MLMGLLPISCYYSYPAIILPAIHQTMHKVYVCLVLDPDLLIRGCLVPVVAVSTSGVFVALTHLESNV